MITILWCLGMMVILFMSHLGVYLIGVHVNAAETRKEIMDICSHKHIIKIPGKPRKLCIKCGKVFIIQ